MQQLLQMNSLVRMRSGQLCISFFCLSIVFVQRRRSHDFFYKFNMKFLHNLPRSPDITCCRALCSTYSNRSFLKAMYSRYQGLNNILKLASTCSIFYPEKLIRRDNSADYSFARFFVHGRSARIIICPSIYLTIRLIKIFF